MAFDQRQIIPSTRGIQFNMELMTPGTPIKRPRPDFIMYWDDLYQHQQRFVLMTHNFLPSVNVRDKSVITQIKALMCLDDTAWKDHKVPAYLNYRVSIDAVKLIFNEMIPILYGLISAKGGLTKEQRRFICSQIESLTDLYYASVDDLMDLSMIEQAFLKENVKNLKKFRNLMIGTIQQFPELRNYFPPMPISPQATSTPKMNVDMRAPRLLSMVSLPSAILSPSLPTMTSIDNYIPITTVITTTSISDSHMSVDQVTLTDDMNDPDTIRHFEKLNLRDVASNVDDFNEQQISSKPMELPKNRLSYIGTVPKVTTLTTSSIHPPILSSQISKPRVDDSAFLTALNVGNLSENVYDSYNVKFQQQSKNNMNDFGNYRNPKEHYPFDSNRGGAFASKNQKFPPTSKDYYPQYNENYSGHLDMKLNYPPPIMTNQVFTSQPIYQQQQPQYPQSYPAMPPFRNDLSQTPINFKEFWDAFFNASRSHSSPSHAQTYMPKIHDWYPKFNGSDDCALDQVLSQWEKLAYNCRMSPELLLSNIHLLLRGDALRWHNAIGSDIENWIDYKFAIINRFQSPDRIVITFMSQTNEQKENEKFDTYFARLKMLMKQARGEIYEKQLITRLITGLRDTRCRDVVRYNSSMGMINWNKIINDINQIEIEYDLISHAHKLEKPKSYENRERTADWKFNPKSYPPTTRFPLTDKKPATFASKSPYFGNTNSSSTPSNQVKNDSSKIVQKNEKATFETTGKSWPWKSYKSNQFSSKTIDNTIQKDKKDTLCSLYIPEYVDASSEILEEIESNREMIMSLYEDNNWTEEHLNFMLSTSTCTNCDKSGHILENCDLLIDENKFRPQCLICHAFDINTENCCQKNY